jgi:hypothetical protein
MSDESFSVAYLESIERAPDVLPRLEGSTVRGQLGPL